MTTDSQQMTTKSFWGFIARCVATITLVVLGSWLIYHNWQMRRIRYEKYSYTAEEAKKLRNFPDAQFVYGMREWSRGNAWKASQFFRQAVSEDPLYMDAWLRLAESEAALGHAEKSRKVLMFVDDLTSGVYRWQWPQMLLASDLGDDEIFLKNTNDLLGHRKLVQDTLHLLDFHYQSDTANVVEVLAEGG